MMKSKTLLMRRLSRMHRQIVGRGLRGAVATGMLMDPVLHSPWKDDCQVPGLPAPYGFKRPNERAPERDTGMGAVSGVVAKRHPQAQLSGISAERVNPT